MKKFIIILTMLIACAGLCAQHISHIETTRSWYYVRDDNGKRVHTFSTSQGQLVAYSDTFYILKKGGWYYTCDARGKRLHTFSVSSVGEILNAAGDTFTSRKGSWIYTWDKHGKRLNTRAAAH